MLSKNFMNSFEVSEHTIIIRFNIKRVKYVLCLFAPEIYVVFNVITSQHYQRVIILLGFNLHTPLTKIKAAVYLYAIFGVQIDSIVTLFPIADWQAQGHYDFLYANRNCIALVVDCIPVVP